MCRLGPSCAVSSSTPFAALHDAQPGHGLAENLLQPLDFRLEGVLRFLRGRALGIEQRDGLGRFAGQIVLAPL